MWEAYLLSSDTFFPEPGVASIGLRRVMGHDASRWPPIAC
jgi:hypothetical protein